MCTVYASALRGFHAVTWSFGVGLGAAVTAALLLGKMWGLAGLLAGFTAGLALTIAAVTARAYAEYPFPAGNPFAFLGNLHRHWRLAAAAAVYNTAIWADK